MLCVVGGLKNGFLFQTYSSEWQILSESLRNWIFIVSLQKIMFASNLYFAFLYFNI